MELSWSPLETYYESYPDSLENTIIWDREKFNNASIDDIRKDFRRELLIPEMGDDEVQYEDDEDTVLRKENLFLQKQEELEAEYGEECSRGEICNEFCIMIDEEVFQSILNAPDPKEVTKVHPNGIVGYVKVITTYKEAQRGEFWPGWGKADLRWFWWLYNTDELEREFQMPGRDSPELASYIYNGW